MQIALFPSKFTITFKNSLDEKKFDDQLKCTIWSVLNIKPGEHILKDVLQFDQPYNVGLETNRRN